MVRAGLGDDESAETNAGQLVGVVGQTVVLQPGDREDGDLQAQLHRGLGQDGQGAEHSGPGQGLELVEPVLSLADLDEVPDHQAEGEEDGAEEESPEAKFFKLLPPRTREISMKIGVGVTEGL